MATAVKTLEATGFVDESGRLHLDDPLDTPSGRVRVSVLIEYDEPVDDGRITSIAQVCDFFVSKAKHLDVVQEIALVGEGVSTEIWTVTSTSRMDFEARYPIYDIQAEVARATDGAIVNFHVVNLEDFRADYSAGILPSGAKSLWKREYASAD